VYIRSPLIVKHYYRDAGGGVSAGDTLSDKVWHRAVEGVPVFSAVKTYLALSGCGVAWGVLNKKTSIPL